MPSEQDKAKLNRDEIERRLWSAIDLLRGLLDRELALTLSVELFLLKRLSDRFDEECEAIRAQGGDPEEPNEHQFYIPPNARWPMLQEIQAGFGDALNRVTALIERSNPKLQGVLTRFDYTEPLFLSPLRQDSLLRNLIHYFSDLDLRNGSLTHPDVVGQVFENLLERFAEESRTGGFEFVTPRQVARFMVEILQPREDMKISDPACGSGGMLVQCAQHVVREGGDPHSLTLCGQEINLNASTLSKVNLLLHGLPDAAIVQGDSIRKPKFLDGGELMLFDIVLSNPPVSIRNWGREIAENDPWDRFAFGIPPWSTGDYAFLQHMISILAPRGRMAALVTQAALSRGGSEARIRQQLVESDLIESVIYLPPGSLPTTSVAPAVVLINKAKAAERRQRILLVDLSQTTGTPRPAAGQRWTPANLDSIVEGIQDFREERNRSKVVTLDQFAEHSFNLKPSLYLEDSLAGERLENLAKIIKGRNRPAPSTSDPSEEVIPVIQGRDLGVRGLSINDLALWPKPAALSRSVFVQEGDILLQRIGEKPKAMLAGKSLEGAFVSDTVYVIRLRKEFKPQGIYLVDFLNSRAGYKQLDNSRRSAVIPTLSLEGLRGLKVPLPDAELTEILRGVHSLEDDLFNRAQRALAIRSQLFEFGDPENSGTELRRLSLETEMLKQSLVRSEELDFQIRNFYPHMVAYGYRWLSSLSDPEKRYRKQFNVLNTLLTFLGSVGLALAASVGKADDLIACKLGKDQLLKIWRGASLGHWVGICRDAANLIKTKKSSPAADAFATMWSPKIEKTLSALVHLRNEDAHGRSEKSKRDFELASIDIDKQLLEVLEASLFFVRHPIRLVESLSVPWKKSGVVLSTLVYSGDHPSLRRENVWYSSALTQGHLYLEVAPDSWLSLYPLLSVEEIGGEKRTYGVDQFEERRRRVVLRALESSREASAEHLQQIGEDLWIWLEGIFGPKKANDTEE
jgi:type I restriction enzyme M protein